MRAVSGFLGAVLLAIATAWGIYFFGPPSGPSSSTTNSSDGDGNLVVQGGSLSVGGDVNISNAPGMKREEIVELLEEHLGSHAASREYYRLSEERLNREYPEGWIISRSSGTRSHSVFRLDRRVEVLEPDSLGFFLPGATKPCPSQDGSYIVPEGRISVLTPMAFIDAAGFLGLNCVEFPYEDGIHEADRIDFETPFPYRTWIETHRFDREKAAVVLGFRNRSLGEPGKW